MNRRNFFKSLVSIAFAASLCRLGTFNEIDSYWTDCTKRRIFYNFNNNLVLWDLVKSLPNEPNSKFNWFERS